MDFGLSEEQQELAALARRILEDRATPARLAEIEAAGGERFDPELWRELARANLLGVAVPEEDGGLGYGIFEQSLVLTEVGRAVAPVPVWASSVLGAMPIARFGNPTQRNSWVTPAINGSRVLTAALSEPVSREVRRPHTRAQRDGAIWRLDGIKTVVPAATIADLILVPATVEGRPAVFLVEPDAHGVRITPQRTTDLDLVGQVELDGAVVGADAVLGDPREVGDVLGWIAERAAVGLAAMQLGVTERALRETAEYTKTRVQFRRPIATFQAVGHRAADAYIDVEGIRLTLWQAAWRLSEGLPATTEVQVAKFWAADAGHRIAHAVAHLHGGMGVATEYPIHRYFLAAKRNEFALGGASDQLRTIGAALAADAL